MGLRLLKGLYVRYSPYYEIKKDFKDLSAPRQDGALEALASLEQVLLLA